MSTLLSYEDAVDIGYGRGRLAAAPAASVRRIDAQLGRPADVNEAWRSPAVADANYARWQAYQNGTGPIAPYALPARLSIHCRGYAVDSDDWYNGAAAAVWRDNGWRQTARYPGTDRDEPWHGEYFAEHDNHINDPASGDWADFEGDDMFTQDDRNTLLATQLALGAGGLKPGEIKDEDTVLARLDKLETIVRDIVDGTGTNGATALQLDSGDTVLGIVRELRDATTPEGGALPLA